MNEDINSSSQETPMKVSVIPGMNFWWAIQSDNFQDVFPDANFVPTRPTAPPATARSLLPRLSKLRRATQTRAVPSPASLGRHSSPQLGHAPIRGRSIKHDSQTSPLRPAASRLATPDPGDVSAQVWHAGRVRICSADARYGAGPRIEPSPAR